MSRQPMQLTDAQRVEVETLAAVLTALQLSSFFGIGRATFFTMMQRDPEIAARYKKGKARAIGSIAQRLIAKARGGDITAMVFYPKTQGGWRETAGLHLSAGLDPVQDPEVAFHSFAAHLDHLATRLAAPNNRMHLPKHLGAGWDAKETT